MKHIFIHFVSFLLGIAVAAAGFTYVFPQIDPQQERLQQSQPPPSHKGEPQQSGSHDMNDGHNSNQQNRPNFTPQDMPDPNSKGAPPPGR